jgi:alpha-glucoside transport system permease protein
MIIVLIWIQAGFATVVLSAAMKGVPDDLAEAAKIDGATDRQAFFRITLPYIKTTIITVITTTVIAVLKMFDIVQAMGLGGGFQNNTIANEMYVKSFTQQNEGYGSALAVVLFIAVIPVVWVNARNQRAVRESR